MTVQMGVKTSYGSAETLSQFEDWLGRPVDTVLAYTDHGSWAGAGPGYSISVLPAGTDINFSIPMYPVDMGVAGLREVAAGEHNDQYRQWAEEILASRQGDDGPIYVRTAWELGGEWFPWTADAQADPEAFKAAFAQMADSFHGVSDRFRMVWDTVGDRGDLTHLYPGDDAVDVISQDLYWQRQWTSADPVEAFAQGVGEERGLDWLADFAAAHGKPLAVPEWGAGGADAGPWIDAMDTWLDTHDVAYANYWNDTAESGYDARMDDGRWPEAGEALRAAFADRGEGGGTPDPIPTGDTPDDPADGDGPSSDDGNGTEDPMPTDDSTDPPILVPVDDDGTDTPPGPDPAPDGDAGSDDPGDLDDLDDLDDLPADPGPGDDDAPGDDGSGGDETPVVDDGGDDASGDDAGGGDAGGGYHYPAAGDWQAIADLTIAFHAATGQWADLDTIIAAGFVPPETGGGEDDGPGEIPDGYPAADDWTAIGALVSAYHDATGNWASFEDIVSQGWHPDDGGSGGDGGDDPGSAPGGADPVRVTGGDGRDNVTLDHIHGAVVDLGGNRDVLTLGGDHSDVTVVLTAEGGNRDQVHGFAAGDILELRGFGEGATLEDHGGGEFRVHYTAGGEEETMRFTLDGTFAAADAVFV